MRLLCCLDGTNAEQISKAVQTFLKQEELTISLLYVTDSAPHQEMERQRARLLRPQEPMALRREQMRQAEDMSAQDILQEGQRHLGLPVLEKVHREGRPEREIVNYAASWLADLVVLCPRSIYTGNPAIGPKSVGHVARFVLDHAPCPVLLVRPQAREHFPLPR
jgi:nucleotide-binding universal stress UspA family protein